MIEFDRDALYRIGRSLLTQDGLNGITWPDLSVQKKYTGAEGETLLQRTVDFIEKLVTCAPIILTDRWRGLDYGAGFGRIASLLSILGRPEQLVCVDAWEPSLNLCKRCGLKNPIYMVPPLLSDRSFSHEKYDFVYAYSVFTHLPKEVFLNNIQKIVCSLNAGGVFVFTVREPKFLEFLRRNNKANVVDDELSTTGYWFGNRQNPYYGDTIITTEWINKNVGRYGSIELVGVAQSEPYQYIIALRPYDNFSD